MQVKMLMLNRKSVCIQQVCLVMRASADVVFDRLDAFLELKLENERLREELRGLQQDMDDEDIRMSLTPLEL